VDRLSRLSIATIQKLLNSCNARRECCPLVVADCHKRADICFRFVLSQFSQKRDRLRTPAWVTALSFDELSHAPRLNTVYERRPNFLRRRIANILIVKISRNEIALKKCRRWITPPPSSTGERVRGAQARSLFATAKFVSPVACC
jgi:hypothetical protein